MRAISVILDKNLTIDELKHEPIQRVAINTSLEIVRGVC
jgi:hypothetical protein